MKTKTLLTVFFILCLIAADAQGYKVTLTTPSYKSGIAYLTFYYGKSMNIQDSALVNSSGVAIFHKTTKLEPGIYSLIFPGKSKLLDFLVDKEQTISIHADTSDLVKKTVITGSKENVLFDEYQRFISTKSKALYEAQMAYSKSKNKNDSIINEKKYADINKDLIAFRERIIKEHPSSMLSSLFSAMKEPIVLMDKPKTKEDSLNNYNYYKRHYWDGVSFMDDRIIRTPFFLPKLERYFRDVLVQAPDTIIKESDYLLLLARNNQEMYKFMINWLTDEYINPKYMGQDAVFVHLFEKYHAVGVSKWLTEKQLKTVSDRAYMLMSNLVGSQAADLNLTDTSGKSVSLYSINSPFTVVVFWDPTCGHCREQIPRLDSIYEAKWKKEGVKVYAVLSENEIPKWKDFIKEHHLVGWDHVYQSEAQKKEEEKNHQANFRQLYDVTQTPTIYLLDKDKRIVTKKLSIQQMDEVLNIKMKNNEGNNK